MKVQRPEEDSQLKKPDRRIFICYAQDDLIAARRLSNLCEKAGLPTWIDVREIKAGDDWRSTMNRAIHECDVFVLLISEAALRSHDATRSEWSTICERKWEDSEVRLIPIRLSNVQPPVFLRNQVCLDALDSQALDTCVSDIHRISTRPYRKWTSTVHSEELEKELVDRFRMVLSTLEDSSVLPAHEAGRRED